ncbi:MAG: hypothetical protein J6V87_06755 [Prevotella sp.]|nr:hypothetical protein [Prevotella sp.]
MATQKKETIAEKLQRAQKIILDSFVDSLKDKDGNKLSSREYYRNVINALKMEEAFSSNRERNFMELLIRKLPAKSLANEIDNLLNSMDDALKRFKCNTDPKYKKSYKTYVNKFILFLKNKENQNDLRANLTQANLNFKNDAETNALYLDKPGMIYMPNMLRTKLQSRLRCQDRVSGDKIWLPLRFIAKIYSTAIKMNIITENLFLDWLDNLVDSVNIHYNDNGKVQHFTINQGVSLWLTPNDNEYDVIIIDPNGKEHKALTPTGKGNEKIPMKVKSISEIAIDHVKSIDRTLRDLSDEDHYYNDNKLPELMKVSDKYKAIQAEDDPNEDEAIKELLTSWNNPIDLLKLKDELYSIKKDGLLRLMASKYNSQKSNGDTFKEIRKIDNDKYIGVIETGIKRANSKDNKEMTLYQELNNNYPAESLLIDVSGSLKGTNIYEIEELEDIIDRI